MITVNVSACYFENTDFNSQEVRRLAIILPSIIPKRTEVNLKIISVIDYKDRMQLDLERNDMINVSVLLSSDAYLNGSEKYVLVQLKNGSAEVPLIGNRAETIVLKAKWVSGESYLGTWITTAWVGVDPPR